MRREAVEILGKGWGVDPVNALGNREKAELISSLRPKWPLRDLLASAGMARSSYHYQIRASSAPDRDAEAREFVRDVFEDSGGTYGRRRIVDELRSRGHAIGERRVARLMAEGKTVAAGAVKGRKGYCSYKGEISEHPGNKVGHNFLAALPNRLWPTDVTMFSIPAGKLYLSPVLDCFDGAIVSWAVSRSPDAEMANSSLLGACEWLDEGDHPAVHSDRGGHYRWPGWIKICEENGLVRSMSRKGCSPDNARCEGFFGRLKVEFFYGRDWDGVTIEEFITMLDAYLRWYRDIRIKSDLDYKSPCSTEGIWG